MVSCVTRTTEFADMDWLDEIAEKQRRKEQERERQREETRRRDEAYKPIQMAHEANYAQYKDRVQGVFDELIGIAQRANHLTNSKLRWKRSERSLILSDSPDSLEPTDWYPYRHRYVQVSFSDSKINLSAEFPNRKARLYESKTSFKSLEMPINNVAKENLSAVIQWLATGEGLPL